MVPKFSRRRQFLKSSMGELGCGLSTVCTGGADTRTGVGAMRCILCVFGGLSVWTSGRPTTPALERPKPNHFGYHIVTHLTTCARVSS